MVLRYRELSGSRDAPDLQSIAARARLGDGHAIQAVAEGAKILGTTLAGLLNVLDPELLVIGGGVTELGELWWRHLEAALRANPMPGPAQVALRPAQLGADAVLVGAAWLAFDGLARAGAPAAG
jgi:glucokinase